jgi:hypothetical protein
LCIILSAATRTRQNVQVEGALEDRGIGHRLDGVEGEE